jgi:hypothetical protein
VNLALAQRQIALAGVALLAALVALAANAPGRNGPNLPKPVPSAGGGWYHALAASHGNAFSGSTTSCGYQIDKRSLGIAHSTLPCNTKIYLLFKGQVVLVQVIASGGKAVAAGHDFELTPALAARIGLKKTQPIKWRYAG